MHLYDKLQNDSLYELSLNTIPLPSDVAVILLIMMFGVVVAKVNSKKEKHFLSYFLLLFVVGVSSLDK